MKIIQKENNDRPLRSTYLPIRSIFDDFFTPSVWDDAMFLTQPNVSADVWEDKDNVFVKMAMPGVKKEDIKINIMEDRVSLSGHMKKEEKSDEDKKYYYQSMESSYEQSFNLPTKIDPDKAEAEFKDGVLTLKMPKANEVKPREIAIK